MLSLVGMGTGVALELGGVMVISSKDAAVDMLDPGFTVDVRGAVGKGFTIIVR